jgi:hypothetical protein
MQNQAEQKQAQPDAKVTKDARITKDGSLALTRPQINIANRVLTTKYASTTDSCSSYVEARSRPLVIVAYASPV